MCASTVCNFPEAPASPSSPIFAPLATSLVTMFLSFFDG